MTNRYQPWWAKTGNDGVKRTLFGYAVVRHLPDEISGDVFMAIGNDDFLLYSARDGAWHPSIKIHYAGGDAFA